MFVCYILDFVEYYVVWQSVGIFDILYMVEFMVCGSVVGEFLDYVFVGCFLVLFVGKVKYLLLLIELGGIIDDVIVYCFVEDDFFIIFNVGNWEVVVVVFVVCVEGFDVVVDDVLDVYVFIVVQGLQVEVVFVVMVEIIDVSMLWFEQKYYVWVLVCFVGELLLLVCIGYIGEDGFELFVLVEYVVVLWDVFLVVGVLFGFVFVGFVVCDMLCFEVGMLLYGYEFLFDMVFVQVGFGCVVVIVKDQFVGKVVMELGLDVLVLVGFVVEGKCVGCVGYVVVDDEGVVFGEIISGVFSLIFGYLIVMVYVYFFFVVEGIVVFFDVWGIRIFVIVIVLFFYWRIK